MKIICEKCDNDITAIVDLCFDKYKVGYPVCPKCHKKQGKYISETDLLLYLGYNEIFYLALTGITSILIENFMISFITIGSVAILFILGFIFLKKIDRKIYENIDSDNNKKVSPEEELKISKSLNWQSILFFALVISFITLEEVKLFFFIVSIIAIGFTFLKYNLSKNKKI